MWMGLIFWFSSQPADDSRQMSLSVGHMAGHILIADYDEWPQQQQESFAEQIDYIVRKAAHFTEYAILGVLLMCRGRYYTEKFCTKRNCKNMLLVSGTGVFYAVTDEIHQLFVRGRSCQFTDVLLDSFGVEAGVAAVCLVASITAKMKRTE